MESIFTIVKAWNHESAKVRLPCEQLVSPALPERETTVSNRLIYHRACAKYVTPHVMYLTLIRLISREITT